MSRILSFLQKRVMVGPQISPQDTAFVMRSLVVLKEYTPPLAVQCKTLVQPHVETLPLPQLVHVFFATVGSGTTDLEKALDMRISEVASQLPPWAVSSLLSSYARLQPSTTKTMKGVPALIRRLVSPSIMQQLRPADSSGILLALARIIIPRETDYQTTVNFQRLVAELWWRKPRTERSVVVLLNHTRALLQLRCTSGAYYTQVIYQFLCANQTSPHPQGLIFVAPLCRATVHCDPQWKHKALSFLTGELMRGKEVRAWHVLELLQAAARARSPRPRAKGMLETLVARIVFHADPASAGDGPTGVRVLALAAALHLSQEGFVTYIQRAAESAQKCPREAMAVLAAIAEFPDASKFRDVAEKLMKGVVGPSLRRNVPRTLNSVALLCLSLAKIGGMEKLLREAFFSAQKWTDPEVRKSKPPNLNVNFGHKFTETLPAATLLRAMSHSGVNRGTLLATVLQAIRVKLKRHTPTPPRAVVMALLGLPLVQKSGGGEGLELASLIVAHANRLPWRTVSHLELDEILGVLGTAKKATRLSKGDIRQKEKKLLNEMRAVELAIVREKVRRLTPSVVVK